MDMLAHLSEQREICDCPLPLIIAFKPSQFLRALGAIGWDCGTGQRASNRSTRIAGVRKHSACRAVLWARYWPRVSHMRNASALRQALHRWLNEITQIMDPTPGAIQFSGD